MMKNNFDNHKFSQPPVHSPVKNEGIIYHLLGYPYPLKRKVWFTPQIPPGGFRYLYSMYVNKESYDPEAPFTHTLANNYDQDKRTTDDSVKTEEIDFSRLSKIKPDILSRYETILKNRS